MRFATRELAPPEPDMTPMIDIVFQLLAFFMFTLNLTASEQDQRVTLPSTEVPGPPPASYERTLTIQLTADGKYLLAGEELGTLDLLRTTLERHRQTLQRGGLPGLADVTIVIRADNEARAGLVQEIMQLCQRSGFQRFALRQTEAAAAGTSD